jgi:hypothetical protein
MRRTLFLLSSAKLLDILNAPATPTLERESNKDIRRDHEK